MTNHLQKLGDQFSVNLPLDRNGFLGRECPDTLCKRYFKIKPGTGLSGGNLPCHCPYCGYKASTDQFHTQDQIDFGVSVLGQQVVDAVTRDLKEMANKFNRRSRGGLFSIKMDVKSSPSPLHEYNEKELETNIECANCTLQYSVYGVFAYCPDCGLHNSLQILEKNLEVVSMMVELANGLEKGLATKLIENALEDCVSAFDGFGRELCRINAKRANKPSEAEKIAFQNLDGAKINIAKQFNLDISSYLTAAEWHDASRSFQKRHLIAHKMGIIDKEYITKTNDIGAVEGRRIMITKFDVSSTINSIQKIARGLITNIK